jgi:hypothetical protein
MVKRCALGTCRNDSRFQHLQTKNKTGDTVTFYRFPAPQRWKETAESDGLLCVIAETHPVIRVQERQLHITH